MSWWLIALACSSEPTHEEALAARDAELAAEEAAEVQENTVKVPWDNDFALAAGAGEVFKQSLIEGTPFEVQHDGQALQTKPGRIMLEGGKPRAYPGTPTTGWVLVEAPLNAGEGSVELVMSLEWTAAQTDLGGLFKVTGTEVYRLDGEPRFTFEKDGDFWVRKPAS